MKLSSLAVLAVAIGVIACNESVTTPDTTAGLSPRLGSNPPPPDVDTGAVAYTGDQTQTFQVRYFFNKTANAGWLKFDGETGDFTVDKNAQIRYSNGVFSGKGIIMVGTEAVDLADVSQASKFSSCEAPVVADEGTVTTDEVTRATGCFDVIIDREGDTDVYITECGSTRTDTFCRSEESTL